ncbi:MAG: hypothetical protein JWO82_4442 [Akkermansiaceae bacterium]|nr:hypothetical protein [Akkermansiaceae bacterium]
MLRRPLLIAPLALALAHGAPKPDLLPAYREGLDAMSSHLWDIAGSRFETALQTPDLDAAEKKIILFRLAEAKIRDRDFAAADKVLADPVLKDDPELPFWRAQSLAGTGHLREAAELLDDKTQAPDAPHRTEAIFTRAALEEALGDSKQALETIAPLLKDKNPAIVESSKLKSAVMLLSLNRPADALAMLPPDSSVKGIRATETSLLRARALLATGDGKSAAVIFAGLLASKNPISRLQKRDAAIGLAQVQLAAGERVAAGDGLLGFLRQNEGVPNLGPAFEQLYQCLPPKDIAPNDAILDLLESWMPVPVIPPSMSLLAQDPPLDANRPSRDGAETVWPVDAPTDNDFNIQALYYRALGMRREGSEIFKSSSRKLLKRLIVEYPNHPLALRALWELARWNLEDPGRKEEAALVLEGVERLAAQDSGEGSLEAAAQITAAHGQFLAGDYQKAAETLKDVADSLNGPARRTASLNAAASMLATDNLPAFDTFTKSSGAEPYSADLALERALFLAAHRNPEGLKALDQFIIANPSHPRLAEARLACAHAALEASVPDLALAKAQLESIPVNSAVPAGSLALAKIRVETRSGDWGAAVELAGNFLKANPDDPRREEITFELGNARFQNKEFNAAQLVFQNLVAARPDGPLAQPAQLLAARSAALATVQSREQSIGLFDKVIAGKGSLADLARLEKADALITMSRLPEAIATLEPWLKAMKKDDPLRMTAGLMLGEALYASGKADKANFDKALALYSGLLADLPEDSPRRFQLQYRIGLTLERKDEPSKALDAYYSVLDLTKAEQGQVSDWQWIDNCGVCARRLLEDAHKWEAAIKVAKKHAALPSPGAKEAGERASTLKQEHMIMEDDDDLMPGR